MLKPLNLAETKVAEALGAPAISQRLGHRSDQLTQICQCLYRAAVPGGLPGATFEVAFGGPFPANRNRYSRIVGRFLILAGLALIVLGIIVAGAGRMGIHLGRLPGDIRIEGRRGAFYFPIVTCVLLSVLLTLISWLFSRR